MKNFSFAPPEAQMNRGRIVIYGWEEVLIEQHAGLFSYETGCIRVRTRDGILSVSGEGLVIAYFGTQDLLIRGKVKGIALQEGIT